MKNKLSLSIIITSILFISCNFQHSQPVIETKEPVEYPVGYIAQSLSTDLYDTTELYPLNEEFLESFIKKHTQYEGSQPVLVVDFPKEWGVVLVERLSEGRELYQIQSQNREWVFLVITSGFGTQRILDLIPVAANLANQSNDILESEIWKTVREVDGFFTITKKYEWNRSLENVTQVEYESNPKDYFYSQTSIEKYFINDFYRFELIKTDDTPDYSAVIFYYNDEKPEDCEETIPLLQAFCEDNSILFTEVNSNFRHVELYDYKLNLVANLDITPFMDLQEGIIFMKEGENTKTVPFGSFDRMKIEMKRFYKIVGI